MITSKLALHFVNSASVCKEHNEKFENEYEFLSRVRMRGIECYIHWKMMFDRNRKRDNEKSGRERRVDGAKENFQSYMQ